jgi:hypothetical protein
MFIYNFKWRAMILKILGGGGQTGKIMLHRSIYHIQCLLLMLLEDQLFLSL